MTDKMNGWKDRLLAALVGAILAGAIGAITLGPAVAANEERSRTNAEQVLEIRKELRDLVTKDDLLVLKTDLIRELSK